MPGLIPETPYVVDNFVGDIDNVNRLYFLSHLHSDHIVGLKDACAVRTLYCHQTTKRLLLRRFPSMIDTNVVGLEYEQPRLVPFPNGTGSATVTLVDANHCPGSAMIVFEGEGHKLLYTGDFRFDSRVMLSPALSVYCAVMKSPGLRRLDRIFLDSTFCHPQFSFVPKLESLNQVVTLVRHHFVSLRLPYSSSASAPVFSFAHSKVFLTCDMLGTEDIILRLYDEFKTMFPSSLLGGTVNSVTWPLLFYINPKDMEERYQQLMLLEETRSLITTDPNAALFHIKNYTRFQDFTVKHMSAQKQYCQRHNAAFIPSLYIKTSSVWWVRNLRTAQIVKSLQEPIAPVPAPSCTVSQTLKRKAVDENSYAISSAPNPSSHSPTPRWCKTAPIGVVHEDRFGVHHVQYSNHSDMNGLIRLLRWLRPQAVTPFVIPVVDDREWSDHFYDSFQTYMDQVFQPTESSPHSGDARIRVVTWSHRARATPFSPVQINTRAESKVAPKSLSANTNTISDLYDPSLPLSQENSLMFKSLPTPSFPNMPLALSQSLLVQLQPRWCTASGMPSLQKPSAASPHSFLTASKLPEPSPPIRCSPSSVAVSRDETTQFSSTPRKPASLRCSFESLMVYVSKSCPNRATLCTRLTQLRAIVQTERSLSTDVMLVEIHDAAKRKRYLSELCKRNHDMAVFDTGILDTLERYEGLASLQEVTDNLLWPCYDRLCKLRCVVTVEAPVA